MRGRLTSTKSNQTIRAFLGLSTFDCPVWDERPRGYLICMRFQLFVCFGCDFYYYYACCNEWIHWMVYYTAAGRWAGYGWTSPTISCLCLPDISILQRPVDRRQQTASSGSKAKRASEVHIVRRRRPRRRNRRTRRTHKKKKGSSQAGRGVKAKLSVLTVLPFHLLSTQ